jgi:hypothetical protein
MRKVKLIYVDGRIEYMNTEEENNKDILKSCTYKNFSDSFKAYVNNRDVDLSNQIKAITIDEETHIFRYDDKQEFYVHF